MNLFSRQFSLEQKIAQNQLAAAARLDLALFSTGTIAMLAYGIMFDFDTAQWAMAFMSMAGLFAQLGYTIRKCYLLSANLNNTVMSIEWRLSLALLPIATILAYFGGEYAIAAASLWLALLKATMYRVAVRVSSAEAPNTREALSHSTSMGLITLRQSFQQVLANFDLVILAVLSPSHSTMGTYRLCRSIAGLPARFISARLNFIRSTVIQAILSRSTEKIRQELFDSLKIVGGCTMALVAVSMCIDLYDIGGYFERPEWESRAWLVCGLISILMANSTSLFFFNQISLFSGHQAQIAFGYAMVVVSTAILIAILQVVCAEGNPLVDLWIPALAMAASSLGLIWLSLVHAKQWLKF